MTRASARSVCAGRGPGAPWTCCAHVLSSAAALQCRFLVHANSVRGVNQELTVSCHLCLRLREAFRDGSRCL